VRASACGANIAVVNAPRIHRRAVLGALGSLLVPTLALAKESAIPSLPLVVSVADEDGPDGPKPARDAAWIEAQLAQVERLFGVHGVHFEVRAPRKLPNRFAHLETRADRDALASSLAPGVVNVFVVASLRDVDDPSRMRMGVHWRPRKTPNKHYAIVAASAMPTTLAHELGHFFGNPHSPVINNVMSYERTDDELLFFDPAQVKRIKSFARNYVRARELLPTS